MFSKLSEIAPQITMQRQLTKWMGTKEESNKISIAEGEYFGTYRGFLLSMNASNLVSIAIGDSVFNPYHPRYPYIYSRLLSNDPSGWKRFHLGDLKDSELHQLANYYVSRKHHFDFWSRDYRSTREIFARYNEMLKKPELRLVVQHATSPDSTIVVTYRPSSLKDKLYVGGVEAKNLPASSLVFQLASVGGTLIVTYLFMSILALILLWRAIWIVGKLGWLELLFIILLYFPQNLIANSFYWQNMFTIAPNQLAIWMVVGLIWQNPVPLSGKKIWTWLFILSSLLIFVNKGVGYFASLMYPLILFLFIFQLVRQKGLRRKVMWRWFTLGFMPVGLFFVLIIGFFVAMRFLIKPLLHILNLSGAMFYNNSVIYSLNFDYWIIMLIIGIFMIIAVSIPGGLILGMLEFPLRLYYRMRRWLSALVTFGAYVMVVGGFTIFGDRLLTRNFFVLFFLVIIGIILSWLAMKFFRFLDPVHHDERKALRKLLESSFGYNEEKVYFDFYRDYLTKLYPKTKVGLAIEGCELGMEKFLNPTAEQLMAIPEGKYFNLDLARLDRHPAASAFPEWIPPKRHKKKQQTEVSNEDSKLKEIRLFYPLSDSNGKKTGYLFLAESGKLYWDSENAGFIAETVSIFNSFLNNIRLNTSYREEQLHLEREKQERILNEQLAIEREKRNQELQEINRRIMDSINYASLIQRSILPKEDTLKQYLNDFFIIWKPRDVVGGDYYWFYPLPGQNKFLLAVIDCTGHGVPGAFMTLMTNSILHSIVRDRNIYSPEEIIRLLHQEVRFTLQQGHSESMKDGLDISLILVDKDKQEISFSGAAHKALFFSETEGCPEPKLLSGDKHSLGGTREEISPELVTISYQTGDKLYLMTDGILDQPVGQNENLKRRIFRDWLEHFETYAKEKFDRQQAAWESYLQEVLELSEQRDDITLLGLRL